MALINSTLIFIPQVSRTNLTKAQLETLAQMAIEKFPELEFDSFRILYQEEKIRIFIGDLSDKFNELTLNELPKICEYAPFEELEIARCWVDEDHDENPCMTVTYIPKKSWVIAQLETALDAEAAN